MSESGQPGAATPGEHGDGPGQHDDPARSGGGGWTPSADWSRGAESTGSRQPAPWQRPDLAPGWASSSPRYGDLPAPLPALPGSAEAPARVNGHRANGVHHNGADAPSSHQAPVSAPPGLRGEPGRDSDGDRLVVPAQRPAPAVEQPPGPPRGFTEPEPDPARHASDEPPAGRPTRWAEPGLPTSAPPAVQVPPVGTAASGFEVPPGIHAPTVD
ncbi:hypothetical protein C1I99_31630, partial [Micromonospora deserti]